MSAAPASADELPLVLASAFHHPDRLLRVRLRARLEDLVEAAQPRHTAAATAAALRQVSGTVLEPFVLDDDDLALATLLARLAFSETADQTRFRVVSRETLGVEGGLVLTNNLRGYYVERYALGRYRRAPTGEWSRWFVAPAALPRTVAARRADPQRGQAVLTLDEVGLRLTLPWHEPTDDRAGLARRLQQHSRVQGVDQPLTRLGLRVDVTTEGVEVRAGSPEAILRLSALGAQAALLVLDSWPVADGRDRPRAFVRLAPPTDEPATLPTIATVTSRYPYAWVDVRYPLPVPLTRAERLAISRWLPPHDSWVSDLLEELW